MDSKARLTRLTVEYLEQPLGIDTAQPRFGWQMEAPPKAAVTARQPTEL